MKTVSLAASMLAVLAMFSVEAAGGRLRVGDRIVALEKDEEVRERLRMGFDHVERSAPNMRAGSLRRLAAQLGMLRRQGKELSQETKAEMARWLVESVRELDVQTPEGRDTRSAVVEVLARYGDNQEARKHILSVLTEGPAHLRSTALRFVGGKGVGGKDVFKKIENLCTMGIISEIDKIVPLFRLDRSRVRPELMRIARTTTDKETLIQAAKYIQRYDDAALLGLALRRFSELGLSSSHDGYWINDSLLAAWLELASGDDLPTALLVVDGISVLTRKCLPVIMKRDLLNHDDHLIRAVVVRLVGRGARFGVIGHEEGITLLREREKTERDASVLRAIRREVRLLTFKRRRSERDSQR